MADKVEIEETHERRCKVRITWEEVMRFAGEVAFKRTGFDSDLTSLWVAAHKPQPDSSGRYNPEGTAVTVNLTEDLTSQPKAKGEVPND